MNPEELLRKRAKERVEWRKRQIKEFGLCLPLKLLDEERVFEEMKKNNENGEDFDHSKNAKKPPTDRQSVEDEN